jgi:hypothetical protein
MAHAATTRMSVRVPERSLAAVACSVCPLLAVAGLALAQPLTLPPGFDRKILPVDAAEFVARVGPRGPLYNSMPLGGYLALRLWPEQRVFSDGRNTIAYEPELIAATVDASFRRSSFEALERRFGFEWAVVTAREEERRNPALVTSPDWIMVYLDDIAAVYVRARGPNAALGLEGYRVLRHWIDPAALLDSTAIDDPRWQQDLAHDGSLALAQAPDSPRAAFLAACGALAAHDAEGFDAAYLRLAWLMPVHPSLGLLAARRRETRQSFRPPAGPQPTER